MKYSKLKLNLEKTEFILFGSEYSRKKLMTCFPINILGNSLYPVEKVRNLGVIFDSSLKFSSHVSAVCKASFLSLRNFRRIRRFLSDDISVTVANALVSCRLDYCNSLFTGLSQKDLHKLQCIQNSLARIVTRSSKYCHITPVLKTLHWLPVRFRCEFKTATLVYKYLNLNVPKYFGDYLHFYNNIYNTRRSDPQKLNLHVPSYGSMYKSKRHFDHSFMYYGPTLWNDIPENVRSATSLSSFRKKLKTSSSPKLFLLDLFLFWTDLSC
jgi:hypothetical protein